MPFDPTIHKIGENAYGRYCVPIGSAHRIAAQTILSGQIYEEHTLSFMRKHAGTGDIIHSGTYFGDFLPALSRAIAPGSKVWAFEANPDNYDAARITCQVNDLRNIELANCAIGSTSGAMKMRIRSAGKDLGGASSVVEDLASVPAYDLIDVSVRKIDDVVPRFREISLLQLDIEGFEPSALMGAVETIAKWHPILILETVPIEWYKRVLAPLGYRIRGRVHENTVLSIGRVKLDRPSLLRRAAAAAVRRCARLTASPGAMASRSAPV